MSLHLPQALSRGALLLLATALATGCYNPRKDKGLVQVTYTASPTVGTVHAGPGDLDDADKNGRVKYEAPQFDVKAERRVGDVTIPKGARVQALFLQGRLVLPPDFEWIKLWRSDFAYAKRYGSKRIVRIDLETEEEEVAPFTALAGARTGRYGSGRPLGVVDEGGTLLKIALLGEDGRVVRLLERVERRSFDEGPQPVDALKGGGYIAHHVGEQGEKFDVIYNAEGVPISPPLTPVLRLLPVAHDGDLSFAVRTDPERALYWPLREDGTHYAKPEALVGLRPVYAGSNEDLWYAWIAVWRTDDGERSTFLRATTDPEKLLASRQDAAFEDLEYATYKSRSTHPSERGGTLETFISRSPGAPGYIIGPAGGQPLVQRVFATVAEARAYLRGMDRATDALNREHQAREYEAWLARKAQAERNEQVKRKKEYEAYRANEAKVDKLLAGRKYAEARDLAWKTSPHAIRRAVLAAVRAGQTDHLTSVDLAEGRLGAEGADVQRIQAALRSTQSRESGVSSGGSAWTGWSPSASTSYSSIPSSSSGKSVQSILDNARWQSQLNYLSGKQSWGYLDGNTVRR